MLADRVFKIPFEANPMVWLYGLLGGALAVTLAGWLGTRATTRQPPLAVIASSVDAVGKAKALRDVASG